MSFVERLFSTEKSGYPVFLYARGSGGLDFRPQGEEIDPMSIDKVGLHFTLTCDNCSQVFNEEFDSFHEAVDAKKDNGWKSKKRNGNWEDWCDECCEESEG